MEEYGESTRQSLVSAFAYAAAIDTSSVSLQVAAASVILTYVVTLEDNATLAEEARSKVARQLSITFEVNRSATLAWCPQCLEPPLVILTSSRALPPYLPSNTGQFLVEPPSNEGFYVIAGLAVGVMLLTCLALLLLYHYCHGIAGKKDTTAAHPSAFRSSMKIRRTTGNLDHAPETPTITPPHTPVTPIQGRVLFATPSRASQLPEPPSGSSTSSLWTGLGWQDAIAMVNQVTRMRHEAAAAREDQEMTHTTSLASPMTAVDEDEQEDMSRVNSITGAMRTMALVLSPQKLFMREASSARATLEYPEMATDGPHDLTQAWHSRDAPQPESTSAAAGALAVSLSDDASGIQATSNLGLFRARNLRV